MGSHLDLTRVPKSESAAKALADAHTQVGDRVERHFLALKSAADLSKHADQSEVVMSILALRTGCRTWRLLPSKATRSWCLESPGVRCHDEPLVATGH